jgi:hypothetical protein
MRITKPILTFALISLSVIFGSELSAQETIVPSHEGWTLLLKKNVQVNGLVDYKGFVKDKDELDAYAQLLADHPPSSQWTEEEQIAYWINAYNVFTVKLIVDHYPVKSIKDLNPTLAIPTVRSIWTKEWFQIGEEDYSLDRIEHKELRRNFEEPRIHFAINCASISCPVLRREAYEPDRLDDQLDKQARLFINDKTRNDTDSRNPRVSKIFSWFMGDFTKEQSIVDYLNQYAEPKLDAQVRLRFLEYNWDLNDSQGFN